MALAACGASPENTETVRLELTSMGSPSAPIAQVNVAVAGVDVHVATGDADESRESADDQGNAWIATSDELGTIDLVRLQYEAKRFLGDVDVYDGPITQIRMRLAPEGHYVTMADGSVCLLDTTRVSPAGVKVNHPFEPIPPPDESKTTVVLAVDVTASLTQTAPCAYSLVPVLRLLAPAQ